MTCYKHLITLLASIFYFYTFCMSMHSQQSCSHLHPSTRFYCLPDSWFPFSCAGSTHCSADMHMLLSQLTRLLSAWLLRVAPWCAAAGDVGAATTSAPPQLHLSPHKASSMWMPAVRTGCILNKCNRQ